MDEGDENGFDNVLNDIPRRARHVLSSTAGRCLELCDTQFCENPVEADSICQSLEHGKENPVHVCDHCSKASAIEVVSIGSSFNSNAIENMRAYLCNHCAERVGKNPGPVLRDRLTDDLKVWGNCEDFALALGVPVPLNKDGGTITLMGNAQKITGCLCGTKLVTQRLCYSHRLKYADEVVVQAQRMQDWCREKYGAKTCFVCLRGNQPRVVAFDGRQWVSYVAKCTAWQCLACGDLVVNQPTTGIFGPQGPRAIVSTPRAITFDDLYGRRGGDGQEVQEVFSEEVRRGEEELRSYAYGDEVSFGESSAMDWEGGSNGNQEGTLDEQACKQGMESLGEQAEAQHGGQDGEEAQEEAQARDISKSNGEASREKTWTLVYRPI
ncbi:uncharacterized protein Triagg1_2456 [Trichoderma aggressivum f. europaeum]|uniref:Uncharacterized protein n=1 Tax=Trichoderma aggressivum f. europaeum TaxID=173218 RepID=A0AAE1IHX1_9HYPO|nr:hypothetical protein Triagg1_2456 [Trichoderma aggressivum f. europaeum]